MGRVRAFVLGVQGGTWLMGGVMRREKEGGVGV